MAPLGDATNFPQISCMESRNTYLTVKLLVKNQARHKERVKICDLGERQAVFVMIGRWLKFAKPAKVYILCTGALLFHLFLCNSRHLHGQHVLRFKPRGATPYINRTHCQEVEARQLHLRLHYGCRSENKIDITYTIMYTRSLPRQEE